MAKDHYYYAAYGTAALSMAIGWNRNSPSLFKTTVDSSVPWLLSTLGGWWLLKALGSVPIGISHKLGTKLGTHNNSNNNTENNKRRLGFLERWYVAHSRSGMHTGFLIALELESSNTETSLLSLEDTRQILRRVCQKFPWLRVKLKRDGVDGIDSREFLKPASSSSTETENTNGLWGDDLYVQVLSPQQPSGDFFAFRQVVVEKESNIPEVLERTLEEESTQEWHDEDPSAPLWRATVLSTADNPHRFSLILAFHHLIVDGVGSTSIAQAILDEMNSQTPNGNKSTDDEATINNNPLAPPMEDLMDTVPTLSHLLIPVLLDRFPSLETYFKPIHWKGLTKHDAGARQSTMVCCPISLNGQQLAKVCEDMKFTFNSLCVATLCKAIAKTVGNQKEHISAAMTTTQNNGINSVNFKVIVAKNERNNCHPVKPDDLGVYLSGPQVYVSCCSSNNNATTTNKAEYQSIASSFQQRLRALYRAAAMDMGLCVFIPGDWIPFASKFAKNEPNGINDSIEFSNLGKVRFTTNNGTPNKWNVKDFWFAQGRRETGAAIIATITRSGEAGEEIRAVMSAFPQAVPRTTLAQIADTWKSDLELLVGKNEHKHRFEN
ncbi:Conserved hypothetical protein [Seminavis robusta]|uniref:Uncharacterized protein n=1 Tax=Seminavis robusta TaxID=568900 RepID=A0A9N8HZ70_9STRA|nr:Conserved hypothetical protein [Seminavis robusta]|eukprot:Sro2795_g337300.1 Conserved hypothetical protein (606) ;mRNA; f:5306-7123